MSGIDTKKIFAWQKAQNEALKEYIDGMMASKTTWLVAAVPSKVWASILYPQLEDDAAYNALWNQILQSSRADGADPLADWDAHLANLAARRQWMTEQHFAALHYTNSLGTDLTIRLPETISGRERGNICQRHFLQRQYPDGRNLHRSPR